MQKCRFLLKPDPTAHWMNPGLRPHRSPLRWILACLVCTKGLLWTVRLYAAGSLWQPRNLAEVGR